MTNITNPNAFLVKPSLSKWDVIKAYIDLESQDIDSRHTLYAPERFILGLFEKRKNNFILNPDNFFCRGSHEVLEQYQKNLESGKLKVVKSLLLPEEMLEKIIQYRKEYMGIREVYNNKRKQLFESAETFNQFLNN
ncbi:MAG: hypothetical protein Q7S33_02950 [Nanoarchaeota archaeon]|nr:hypothetical protein [Nanoarchaeota archaeon]